MSFLFCGALHSSLLRVYWLGGQTDGALSDCDSTKGAVWFVLFSDRSVIGAVRSALIVNHDLSVLWGSAFVSVAGLSGGQTNGVAVCFDFCAPQEPCVIRTSPAYTRERGVVSLTAMPPEVPTNRVAH